MAESNVITSTPGTPTRLPAALATLPSTPKSLATAAGQVANFLKPDSSRKRRWSDASLGSPTGTTSLGASPAPISPKFISGRYQTQALTGAAAMADGKRQREEEDRLGSRQTSPNPARSAIGALLGAQALGMSKASNTPNAANTVSEPIAAVAASIQALNTTHGESAVQTSPVSMSSLGNLESTSIEVMNANGAPVASPGPIDDSRTAEGETASRVGPNEIALANAVEPEETRSNKALTFPGPLPSSQTAESRRGMSLPHSGLGHPQSPSTKKHRCPYCATDFTRHHNLKSHLLTHSHEKPYLCETCNARFRRLHDLKRHTKLHTGERPHVCPKCDRSFARGDALARHNKGQGGCAGRRSSMGSYGGDDKADERLRGSGPDDGMHGLMYTGEASHEPERMDEDSESLDAHGTSLPSIRKHDAPPDMHHRQHSSDYPGTYQPRQPSTYPPVAARPPSGGLYPPGASHGGSSSNSTTPAGQNSHNQYSLSSGSGPSAFQGPGSNVFAQGGMTESPKPLSPAGHPESSIHRNRSPSLNQQLQQHQFGRRATTHTTSPPMNLPPPAPGSNNSKVPHLPSLPGLTPPESRYTLHSQSTGPTSLHLNAQGSLGGSGTGSAQPPSGSALGSPGYHSQVGNASANNSLSSHGTGPLTAGDQNPYNQLYERLHTHVRSLEGRIDRLQDEVVSLKTQLKLPPHR